MMKYRKYYIVALMIAVLAAGFTYGVMVGALQYAPYKLLKSMYFQGIAAALPEQHQSKNTTSLDRDIEVVIDGSVQLQRIDGFGSSQRMWRAPHLAGGAGLPDIANDVRNRILTELYTELGLSRFRSHGVGYKTEAVNDNADPLNFDWSKFIFDCNPGTGCGVNARINYVKQARNHGLTTVLSENNPMRWMGAPNPEEYAENTLALLLHWRKMGVEPPYQTLMNEPSHRAQALYHRQGQVPWADAVWHLEVVKALGPRMRAEGLRTMLVVPDDLNACLAYPIAKTVLEDPEARKYVGALAYHMYGGSRDCLKAMKVLSLKYDVPVWMTEHFLKPGYEGAFEWAKEIHKLIADYRVSAVDYMWGFFGDWVGERFNEEDLIQIAFHKDGRYVSHRRTFKYYLTGQFSRFVRPGYVRVGTVSASNTTLVTAYRGDEKLVIVVINDSNGEQAVNVSIRGVPIPHSFSAVRSSRKENWKELQPIVPNGSSFRLVLAPQSVATLVGTIE